MNVITVTGKIKIDHDTIMVYCDGNIYGLSRQSNDWGSNRIGGYAPGGKITTEVYQRWESECTKTGTFVLTNSGWERII